jgi:hypothetical protein
MTSIHAPVPADMKEVVTAAKRRGEDAGTTIREEDETRSIGVRKTSTTHKLVMKKKTPKEQDESVQSAELTRLQTEGNDVVDARSEEQDMNMDVSEDEDYDPAGASKENDPSLSPSPVAIAPPSPRKNILGKRPLSVLATWTDSDMVMVDSEEDEFHGMTASEKNIAANIPAEGSQRATSPRNSSKLAELNRGTNAPGRMWIDDSGSHAQDAIEFSDSERQQIYDDLNDSLRIPRRNSGEGKENYGSAVGSKEKAMSMKRVVTGPASSTPSASATSTFLHPSKVSKPAAGVRKVSAAAGKPKPRVGVRRL